MYIQLIAKRESSMTGTLRYASSLHQSIQQMGLHAELTFPERTAVPVSIQQPLKKLSIDLETFFTNYPLRAHLNGADIYHLTGQMLATLLLFQNFPKPVVISVLDIIPHLVRNQPDMSTLRHPGDRLFYQLALAGLRRADSLIAISHYTRQTLIEALKLPADRIKVVYPGVDLNQFRAMPIPETFWSKYGLQKGGRYILFVGSEDPRKNLFALIKVFARVKQKLPGVKLIKVGPAHYTQERQKLMALIHSLSLQQDILFVNYVPDEHLPFFYNAAEVLMMPSIYEGFGLPLVEAMACGTPVIYGKAGSLPEVGGEAGIQVVPYDIDAMAEALLSLLESSSEKLRLKQAGPEQAAKFSLQRTVCTLQEVYQQTTTDSRWEPSTEKQKAT